ncbi:histidine kinase [Parafrankia colletiae]|uniref:Histidine kinase n=1 Tax=Parafrankia colletiae TaxID=573497 RepID=A0A1S1QFM8_9ACTN|nr:ATP-binding protein [Parafrankia colletiae]MCK9900698.1 histidine kinase [Frankia sp. Cpl3]OHV32379.1 histidine kinase [Parafrankia colletiae]
MIVATTAHQALGTVAVRAFAALRILHVAYLVGYVVVWRSWYTTHPAGLAPAVAMAVWGVVFALVVLALGRLPRLLVAGNVLLAAAVGAGAALCLPAQSAGGTGTWVFSASTHAAVVAAWAYRRRAFTGVVVLLVTAFLTGGAAAQVTLDNQATGSNQTPLVRALISAVLLVGIATLFRVAIVRLGMIASDADTRLGTAAAERQAADVTAARRRDRRERERMLHDTVLNTLTGIAWGGGARDRPGTVLTAEQCRYAIDAVRTMLDGTAAATRDLTGPMLRVVAVARSRGLRVDVPPLPATDLPAEVVRALAGAAQELLANVRRHAGTDQATLAVTVGPGPGPGRGVRVVVADEGRGFLAQDVPADRLGLARSVHARLAEVGGQAAIRSEPGRGTTAELTWTSAGAGLTASAGGAEPPVPPARAEPAGQVGPGAGAEPVGRAAPSPGWVPSGTSAAELRDSYAAGLRRTVAVAAAIWFGCTAVVLVATLPSSRSVVLSVSCWCGMALLVAVAAGMSRRRPLRRHEALVVVALGLVITVVVGLGTVPTWHGTSTGGPPSRINTWPVLVLPVLLALVAVSRLFVAWLVAITATIAVLGVLVLTGADAGGGPATAAGSGGTGPLALAQLLAATNGQVALQIMVAMGGPVLRRTADQVARALEEETARAALEQSERAVRADRERGLATIQQEVLPMLEAVADGLLDPRDQAVRDRCARHAAAIRRTLVSGAAGALGELAPAVVGARAHGLEVEVRVVGEPRHIPPAVCERLAEVLPGMLWDASAAGAGGAVLTLIGEPAGGQLFLTYRTAARPAGPAPADAEILTISTDVEDNQACVEIAWSAVDQHTGPP